MHLSTAAAPARVLRPSSSGSTSGPSGGSVRLQAHARLLPQLAAAPLRCARDTQAARTQAHPGDGQLAAIARPGRPARGARADLEEATVQLHAAQPCLPQQQQPRHQQQQQQQLLQQQVMASAAPAAAAPAAGDGVAAAAGRLQQLAVAAAAVGAVAAKLQWRRLVAWCQRQQRLQRALFGAGLGTGTGTPPPVLAALSAVPLLPGGGFTDLFTNRVFLAGFWAWFTAQTLKIFTKYLKKGVWDLRAIVDSGGMPSSHSALCAGITTAIAYQHGMGSSAFALAVALSSIVMYDAAGVRRHAGKQAEVLNQVIGELLEGHPVSDVKLKEVLGHTPLQVGAGAVLGVLFGIFFPTPDNMAATAQHLLAA